MLQNPVQIAPAVITARPDERGNKRYTAWRSFKRPWQTRNL